MQNKEMVVHPNHYQLSINIEVMDLLKTVLTEEQFKGFCLGNIYKYIFRADNKNGLEDYKKALQYLGELKNFSIYINKFTNSERMIIQKSIETLKNENLEFILKTSIDFNNSTFKLSNYKLCFEILEKYIKEKENEQTTKTETEEKEKV